MRKQLLAATVATGALALMLAACAPQPATDTAPSGGGDGSSASTDTTETTDLQTKPYSIISVTNENIPQMYDLLAQQAADWAPEVRTLEDGTQIQRTPDSVVDMFYWDAPSAYNTLYLDADNRGCESCHENGLADLVDNHTSFPHWKLSNGLGTVVNVKDCITCHDDPESSGQRPYEGAFGQLVHGIHNRVNFEGDCMSCHTSGADGQLKVWDLEKYNILTGINKVENVQGDFSFNQDHIQGDSLGFTYPWPGGAEDYAVGPEKVFTDQSYDEWEINIAGEVDNPFTITVQELIDQAPSETFVSSMQCFENIPTGELLAQAEVTGVPLRWIIDKAGVHDGVNAFTPASSDGSDPQPYTDEVIDQTWLVYEVNGEPLTRIDGYPIRIWMPDHKASLSRRSISDITFETLPADEAAVPQRWANEAEPQGDLKPNVAFCNIHEGQIIKAGEPYTFEGFAEGLNYSIGALEFSADGGETWTRYETPGTNARCWTWWNFAFTPEEPGAYVLQVRGETTAGGKSVMADEVMVVAK